MFKRLFLSDKNMMIAIAINAFIITLMYFPSIHSNYDLNLTLANVDHLFIFFFLIEAMVKLSVYKPKKYFADSWNVFDFFIVVISLPSLITFMPIFEAHDLSVLKVLRLFRMIRLVRFIKFVPRMSMIMEGVVRALKASVFVMLVLIFLNFILALFTCHFFGEMEPDHFGNPAIASYTIFQLFTVEGWYEIPKLFEDDIQSSLMMACIKFCFVIVVLMGGMFGMSLANAIFVDEMTMDNNRELEIKIDSLHKHIQELKNILKEKG